MTVLVIGAGPAGLMAAETIASAGRPVLVADRMPSVARKFLMAGRGGLNLTHTTPLPGFLAAYGAAQDRLRPYIDAFTPADLIAWCEGLGQPVFSGSSGRVFPVAMKASPLLRAWLARLDRLGVRLLTRHDWQGFSADGAALFTGRDPIRAQAVVLALGGASWPRLGSDGAWAAHLADVHPFRPSNMGFCIPWSPHMARFFGTPLKRIAFTHAGRRVRGEAMITAAGIEGGAIYALSAAVRDTLRDGPVTLHLDLRPDTAELHLPADRRAQSLSTFLRKAAHLPQVGIALVQAALHAGAKPDLGALIKAVPLTVTAAMPIARAISSAGGLSWDAVDEDLMLRARKNVFAAGEMLDWEAPTGGYLLQACLATGRAAGRGVLART